MAINIICDWCGKGAPPAVVGWERDNTEVWLTGSGHAEVPEQIHFHLACLEAMLKFGVSRWSEAE